MLLFDWIFKLFERSEPGEVVHENTIKETTKPKRKRKKAVAKQTKDELSKLTKSGLIEHAEKCGIKINKKMKKADLVDNILKQQK